MARVLGMSWRRLHSPMLFLWGRALQGNQRHWPDGLQWSQHAKALAPIQDWHKELTQSSAPWNVWTSGRVGGAPDGRNAPRPSEHWHERR